MEEKQEQAPEPVCFDKTSVAGPGGGACHTRLLLQDGFPRFASRNY